MNVASDPGKGQADQPGSHTVPSVTQRSPRWSLIILFAVYACGYIDRSIINILQEPIKRELLISDAELGLLSGLAFALLYTVLGIPIARMAERRSRSKIIVVSVLAWSVMTALCGLATSFFTLFLFRVGVGVGEAGYNPSAQSLIADYYPPARRATAISFYVLGLPVGILIGASAGGYLAQYLGWRFAFTAVALPGLLLALAAGKFLFEPQRGQHDAIWSPTEDAIPPSLGAVVSRMFGSRSLRHVSMGIALATFGGFGIGSFVAPFYLRNFHLSLSSVGLILGIMGGLGAAIGTIAGGLVTDWAGKYSKAWYAYAPAFATLISWPITVGIFLAPDWHISAALLLVSGMFSYVGFAPSLAILHNIMPARMRATAVAILLLLMNLIGLGLGPPFVGALSDIFANMMFSGHTETFATTCADAAHALASHTAPELACATASAAGVKWALVICSLAYVWSAVHYFLAARSVKAELTF